MRMIANSQESLQRALGDIREEWARSKYLRIDVKAGRARSIPQNDLTHAWYEQLARELREDDARGWKRYCKLTHGVPILLAEDADFRNALGSSFAAMSYEQRLQAMDFVPVTSIMTRKQLGQYADFVSAEFAKRGVYLERESNGT